MKYYNYFESLKFDKERVRKRNKSRVSGLKNIKLVGNYKNKNKYNYVFLDDKIIDVKDIIIVIDNNLLRIDNLDEIKYLDECLNSYDDNINFFGKNKFNKNYTKIKDQKLLDIYKKIIKIYTAIIT